MTDAVMKYDGGMLEFNDMTKAGEIIAKCGMFGFKRMEEVVALGMVAQAEGRPFATVVRDYHVINGKPALKADAILARFQEAGGSIEWLQYTDEICEAKFTHPKGGSVTVSWDSKRVQQAQLGSNGMHAKYPRQMKKSRVIAEGVRAVWPAAICGFVSPEELEDIVATTPPPKGAVDITAGVQVSPPAGTKSPDGAQAPSEAKTEAPAPAPAPEKAKPVRKAKPETAPAEPEKPKAAPTGVFAPAPKRSEVKPPEEAAPQSEPEANPDDAAPADDFPEQSEPSETNEDGRDKMSQEQLGKVIKFFGDKGITQKNLEYFTGYRMAAWSLLTRKQLLETYAKITSPGGASLIAEIKAMGA